MENEKWKMNYWKTVLENIIGKKENQKLEMGNEKCSQLYKNGSKWSEMVKNVR